jgi:hypothetical protein
MINPTGLAANKDRYSFVVFHSPNPDAIISSLEPCQGPDNPAKFAPITAGEHLRARAEASRNRESWRLVTVPRLIACNRFAESLFYKSLDVILF